MSIESIDINFKTLVGIIVRAEMEGKPRHELLLELGPTPKNILHAGGVNFENLDLVIKAKTISKMHFDHGVQRGIIERIPEILETPKAIYHSASGKPGDSVVVMTFETQRGYPLIIPIHAKRSIGRDRFCNEVTSMYAKEGPNPEEKWKKAGLLIWKS